MPTNTQKELAAAKAHLAALKKAAAIEVKQHKKLGKLYKKHGFESAAEFADAILAAAGARRGRKPKVVKAGKPVEASGKSGRKTRAVITPEIKAKVKSLAEAGKTGKEIAKVVGISLPSVQNIKRELGLTKKQAK